jgi:N-acetylmuramoyl-L-alanine amidase
MGRSNKSLFRAGRGRSVSRRAQLVWAALVGAMTVVGGGLFLMDRGLPTASGDGLTLTPLMATATPDTVEVVFNTPAPLDKSRWLSIVIHDSGSPVGNPASLDAQARANNLRGLGYHFVIGNGNGMEDGQLAIGRRWLDQAPGAHAAGANGDWYNRHSIGICLVGDGNRKPFTQAQVRRLVQLVDSLCREFKIPPGKVVLHSQICNMEDPGRLFPEATLRAQLSRNP